MKLTENFFLFWLLSFPIISHIFNFSLGPYPDITFNRVTILLLFLIIFFRNVYEKKLEISGKLFFLLSAFLIAAFYSCTRSFTPNQAFQTLLDGYAIPIIVFYIGTYFFNRKKIDIARMSWFFLLLGSYVASLGIIEFITHYDFFPRSIGLRETEFYVRSNGPFSTSETYALFLSLCFFIALYIKNLKKNSWNSIEKIALALILLGILCSMLRTIYLSFFIAFSFPIIYYQRKRVKYIFSLILIFVIIFALFPLITSSPIYEERIINYPSIATRFSAYYTALAIIKDHIIQGIGLLNFSVYSKMYKYNILYKGYSRPDSPHNVFLAILLEMGLLGMIPFCGILLWMIKYFRKAIHLNIHGDMKLISILIVFLLPFLSLNLSTSYPNNFLFFFILAYLYSTTRKIIKDRDLPENQLNKNLQPDSP